MKAIDNWDVIKHEKFMDVAFEVEYAHEMGDVVHVCGYWWNQGTDKSWLVPYRDPNTNRRIQYTYHGVTNYAFQIKKSDLHLWSKVINPRKSQCLRKCDWEKCA